MKLKISVIFAILIILMLPFSTVQADQHFDPLPEKIIAETIIENSTVFPNNVDSIWIAAGDLTNDGTPDLVITKGVESSMAGAAVFQYNDETWDNGTLLAGPSKNNAFNPVIAPIRNDGSNWLVYSEHQSGNSGEWLRAHRYDDVTLVENQDITSRIAWPGWFAPGIGDVNQDGNLEIWVVSYQNGPSLHLRKHEWDPVTLTYPGFELKDGGENYWIWQNPLAADYLGDGTQGMIWLSGSKTIDLVSYTPGTGTQDYSSNSIIISPENITNYNIGKFDSLLGEDIVFSTWNGSSSSIYLVSGGTFSMAELISNIPELINVVQMADLNNDGNSEIYAAGVDGGIYGFDEVLGLRQIAQHPDAIWQTSVRADFDGSGKDRIYIGGVISGRTFRVVQLSLSNAPPIADCGGQYSANEGDSILLDGTNSFDPNEDELQFLWEETSGVCTIENNTSPTPFLTCDDNNQFTVTLTINDGTETDTAETIVNITNVAPTATFENDDPVNEGSNFNLTLASPADPSSIDTSFGFEYAFDCGNGYGAFSSNDSASCPTYDDDTLIIKGMIKDKDGGMTEYTTSVFVNNLSPTLDSINLDQTIVPVGTVINASASFTDPGILDTHTATWDWGDDTSIGTITQGTGFGSIVDNHTYNTPGLYTITLKVTDDDGGEDTTSFSHIIVYDTSAGFVTGGGWIDSPESAYYPDPGLIGKATFGFVSKYKRGGSTPMGSIVFQLKSANLNFKSTSYDWLVISGEKAICKGVGIINGQGEYGFILIVVDGDLQSEYGPDQFRIKIWAKNTGKTIYDNQLDAPIDINPTTVLFGGSIIIHNR